MPHQKKKKRRRRQRRKKNVHFCDPLSWVRFFWYVLQSDSWWTQAMKQNDKQCLATLQAEGSINMPQKNDSVKQLVRGLSFRQWIGTNLCTCVGSVPFFDNICGRCAIKLLHFYSYVNCMSHSRTLRLCSHSSSCFVQGHGDSRKSINVILTSIRRVITPPQFLSLANTCAAWK